MHRARRKELHQRSFFDTLNDIDPARIFRTSTNKQTKQWKSKSHEIERELIRVISIFPKKVSN
jgi:hypothetical protein